MEDSHYEKERREQQGVRRDVQADHLAACAEKWKVEPTRGNLKLMQHVMERISHDESLIHQRELNLKGANING